MLKVKVTLKYGSSIERQFDDYKTFKDWLSELEYHDNKVESYEIHDLNHISRDDDIERLGTLSRELLANRYSDSDWDAMNFVEESGAKLKYNC